jgi:glycosyltransferase involved in cell wall biosynthesis
MNAPHQPFFSIVVPTRDRPDLLAEALRSVLGQTLPDFECIVVDDGGSVAVKVPDDPRITVVRRRTSGGPAAARNTGLEAAKGCCVAFLDDDDLYRPGRLADVRSALETNPVVLCWRTGGHRSLDGDVSDVILDDLVPHLGQVAVHRDTVPRFDEALPASEDVEWWLRVARAAPVVTVPRVGYAYRVHPGVRQGIGPAQRIAGLTRLIEGEADYFQAHPRALAFQLRQIGLAELRRGDRKAARRAFLRSLRARPQPRSLWHLLRSSAPASRARGRDQAGRP